jgi:hypothetical protein
MLHALEYTTLQPRLKMAHNPFQQSAHSANSKHGYILLAAVGPVWQRITIFVTALSSAQHLGYLVKKVFIIMFCGRMPERRVEKER